MDTIFKQKRLIVISFKRMVLSMKNANIYKSYIG